MKTSGVNWRKTREALLKYVDTGLWLQVHYAKILGMPNDEAFLMLTEHVEPEELIKMIDAADAWWVQQDDDDRWIQKMMEDEEFRQCLEDQQEIAVNFFKKLEQRDAD